MRFKSQVELWTEFPRRRPEHVPLSRARRKLLCFDEPRLVAWGARLFITRPPAALALHADCSSFHIVTKNRQLSQPQKEPFVVGGTPYSPSLLPRKSWNLIWTRRMFFPALLR
ncbi:hypothetical protein N658DRAFT_21354 [Parathielavia hyrcaniae]|uniref:Uncharacterized protein n=1 Tax=Parathielavia hyrcaniae TaxID=113614 RepID=A0AAN6QA89_9PEZI|nr:hypothetical protein N658DRAFT_21354 [Parathielavia hyrcaniae]